MLFRQWKFDFGMNWIISPRRLDVIQIEPYAKKPAERVADAFVNLADLYSTELLAETYALSAEWEAFSKNKHQGKAAELLRKTRRAKVKLNFKRSVKDLWDAFHDAKIAEQEFLYLHDLFVPDILPENFLSHALERLHADQNLAQPQRVIDGREIYERLHREAGPHYVFGYQRVAPQAIRSNAYDRVERLRRG